MLPINHRRRLYPKRAFQAGGEVDDDPQAASDAAAGAAANSLDRWKTMTAAAPVQRNPSGLWGAHGSDYDPQGNTSSGHVWNAAMNTWSPALK